MTTTDTPRAMMRGIQGPVPLNRPLRRTKTRRDAHAQDARKALSVYRNTLSVDADEVRPGRLSRLLWAAAFIEQAIYLETGGALGEAAARPASVVRRLSQPAPRVRPTQ